MWMDINLNSAELFNKDERWGPKREKKLTKMLALLFRGLSPWISAVAYACEGHPCHQAMTLGYSFSQYIALAMYSVDNVIENGPSMHRVACLILLDMALSQGEGESSMILYTCATKHFQNNP